MKTEFDITLTSQDMYRFSMYHAYSGFHGWFSVIIGILLLIMAVSTTGEVTVMYTALYAVFGIVFLVYLPINLYLRSKRQLLLSEVLRNALHYVVDETGIHTSQKEEKADLPWEQVYKIVSTKHNVLVYSNRIHAYVIPKEQLADKYELFREIAKANLPTYRFKMK
ncbi:MAG: YcxB family protein [Lachnospiraceae bacterium]|nr:YcxB family protein [Lachnospiraceae bacterium]